MPLDSGQLDRKLWLTVILRAQQEANGQHLYGKDAGIKKYHARKWLTRPSKGLYEVCALAGFNEEEICVLIRENQKRWPGVAVLLSEANEQAA